MKSWKKWTKEELAFLIQNYEMMTWREIGQKLGRSRDSIFCKVKQLTLSGKMKGKGGKGYNYVLKPELSYIIGVLLGDGHIVKQGYSLRLNSVDYDFCEAFASAFASVLRMQKPPTIIYSPSLKQYIVSVGCKKLYNLLKDASFHNLKQIIEKYPAHFIRGLADSEGSINKTHRRIQHHSYKIKITNTNLELLQYVKFLLERYFDIQSYINLSNRKGNAHIWNGKLIIATKDCYALIIGRKEDILKFFNSISFAIQRKKIALENAISEMRNFPRTKRRRTL